MLFLTHRVPLFFSLRISICLYTFLDPITSEISTKNTLSSSVEISPFCARNFKFISIFWFLLGALNCSMAHQKNPLGANLLSLDWDISGYSLQEFIIVTLGLSCLLLALGNTINNENNLPRYFKNVHIHTDTWWAYPIMKYFRQNYPSFISTHGSGFEFLETVYSNLRCNILVPIYM